MLSSTMKAVVTSCFVFANFWLLINTSTTMGAAIPEPRALDQQHPLLGKPCTSWYQCGPDEGCERGRCRLAYDTIYENVLGNVETSTSSPTTTEPLPPEVTTVSPAHNHQEQDQDLNMDF